MERLKIFKMRGELTSAEKEFDLHPVWKKGGE